MADSEDARASFVIDFTVDAAKVAAWQTKTDMTDAGYVAYLEETLGEDGFAELIAALEEAEAEAEASANSKDGHGERGGHWDDDSGSDYLNDILDFAIG